MQFCSISGQECMEPVVSLKSGHVFERSLIMKQIEAVGICPVTEQELHKEDLLDVRTQPISKPRPAPALHMRGLLHSMQDTHDQVLLENYHLKNQLHALRQELSAALYQHDAACRVIARMIQEKEALKQQVVQQQPLSAPSPPPPQHDLPEVITQKALALKQQRKQNRKDPLYLQQFSDASSLSLDFQTGLHSKENQGITAVDLKQDLVVTGGKDGHLMLFSAEDKQVLGQLHPHGQPVTQLHLLALQDTSCTVVSSAQDGLVQVQAYDFENRECQVLYSAQHHGPATGVAQHPLPHLIASCAEGQVWIHDWQHKEVVAKIEQYHGQTFSCLDFNPDGHLLALGNSQGQVQIYSLGEQQHAETLETTGPVVALSFSANGYHLASMDSQGVVSLWDLRKTDKLANQVQTAPASCMAYSPCGRHLFLAGDSLQIVDPKTWQVVSTSSCEQVNCLRFSELGDTLVMGAGDRQLSIYK